MAVSSFPPASGGGGGSNAEIYSTSSGVNLLTIQGIAGIYTLKLWSKTYGASPTGTVRLSNNLDVVLGEGTLVDPDSGASQNPIELTIRATGDFTNIILTCNADTWFSIIRNNEFTQAPLLTTTVYATSQSLTFANQIRFVLIGGGGNGGTGAGSQVGGGGGGGGGFYTAGALAPAGTYSLVAGSAGGNSTFNGVTALGGQNGANNSGNNGGNGGNGGSGGGGGHGNVSGFSGGGPGAGGINGANGANGTQTGGGAVGGTGGIGSGLARYSLISNAYSAGGGGGQGGAGAGGSGALVNVGITGGAGGLIVMTGV